VSAHLHCAGLKELACLELVLVLDLRAGSGSPDIVPLCIHHRLVDFATSVAKIARFARIWQRGAHLDGDAQRM